MSFVIVIFCFAGTLFIIWPSIVIDVLCGTVIVIFSQGIMIDGMREIDAMGVSNNASIDEANMDDPNDNEYPVDPIGVDITTPSIFISILSLFVLILNIGVLGVLNFSM